MMMRMVGMHGGSTPTIRSAANSTASTKAASSHTSISGTSPSTLPRPYPLLTPRSSPTHHHLHSQSTPPTISPTTAAHHHSTMCAATTTALNMHPAALPTPSRKRKIIVDPPTASAGHKRHRTWTELEYEEMLEEATLLREELELLIAVSADLCRDLSIDPSQVGVFSTHLKEIEEKMASTQDLTEQQVREMCQQMIRMMQYLCQRHYDHFALVDMQDHLRECRDRFMRFICQYAAMIGLYR